MAVAEQQVTQWDAQGHPIPSVPQSAPPPVTSWDASGNPIHSDPPSMQLSPKQSQDASDALIYSNLINVPPSYALEHHDQIQESFGERLGEYAKAGWEGLTKESIIGEMVAGKVPEPFENEDEIGRFIEGFGRMVGDLPFYLGGGVLGGLAGGAAGTFEAPGIGTISGAVVGAGAGGFGLTEGLRQWLVDKYKGNKISAFDEVLDVMKATGKGVLTGGTMSFAGEAAPLASGVVGRVLGARAYKTAAELATMTTVGSLLEGKVPTARDFVENAAMFAAMHIGTRGMDFAKKSLPAIQDRLFTNYSRDAVHPRDMVSEAGKKTVESEPADNPLEILNKIDNEIALAAQGEAEPEETSGTPPETTAEPTAQPAAQEEGKETGISNVVTEAERSERGLPEVEVEARRTLGNTFESVKEKVDKGDIDPRVLAEELAEKPRALNAEESAALIYGRMRLQNEHQSIMDGIEDARQQGDTAREARERERMNKVEEDINTNDEAARRTGYEQGLGLAARKLMVRQDYSLANTLQRARVASKDGTVSPELRNRLETLTNQLTEANKRIDAYEEANKQSSAQETVNRIARREARAEKRASTKADLKSEREVLYKDLNKELMQLSANPVLNPKLYELFGKLALNHIREGIVTIEGIVDAIHAEIQDKGISKREIRDYISQYGRTRELSKDDLQKRLREARSQGKLISSLEDVDSGDRPAKSGLQREEPSARTKELRAQLDEAMREAGMKQSPEVSPESRLKAYKTRLQNQVKELETRLKTGDYSKPTKKQTILDSQAEALKERAEKLKSQVEDAIQKQKLESQTKVEKAAHFLLKWRRALLLSSLSTLGKLQNAAMLRMGITPIEEMIGGVLSKIPGISDIAEKAPREGGLQLSAEAKAFGQFFEKETYQDIAKAAKGGKSSIDYLYGRKKSEYPPEALDFFGNLHSAIKVLPKRAEFFRSVEKRAQWAIDHHLDIQDPKVMATITSGAYLDAQRAIFMQPNFVSEGFRSLVNTFERNGLSGKAAAFMLKVVLPIVKVPTNIAFESGTYAVGTAQAGLEILNQVVRGGGLDKLTMAQADNILRSMKKGSMGLAVLAIGYYAGQAGGFIQAGGFYQEGDNKKKGPLKAEDLVVGGVNIPHIMQDNPVFLVLQMGATIRKVNDAYTVKGKSGSLIAGTTAAGIGAVKQIPFASEGVKAAEALKSPESAGLFVDDLIQSMIIPPDLRRLAQMEDPTKRKPTNLKESIEANIPGLRETVPAKKSGKKFSIRGMK